MDVLKMEPHIHNGWENLDIFGSRMWAHGRFRPVQPLDMLIDMAFPSFSVNKLVYPCCRWERRISETKGAIPGAGEGTAVDDKVALDGKGFRPLQMILTVILPFGLAPVHKP